MQKAMPKDVGDEEDTHGTTLGNPETPERDKGKGPAQHQTPLSTPRSQGHHHSKSATDDDDAGSPRGVAFAAAVSKTLFPDSPSASSDDDNDDDDTPLTHTARPTLAKIAVSLSSRYQSGRSFEEAPQTWINSDRDSFHIRFSTHFGGLASPGIDSIRVVGRDAARIRERLECGGEGGAPPGLGGSDKAPMVVVVSHGRVVRPPKYNASARRAAIDHGKLCAPTLGHINDVLAAAGDGPGSSQPPRLVVVVVEEKELRDYLWVWPHLTYAVLAHSERGVAYARFAAHRAFTQGETVDCRRKWTAQAPAAGPPAAVAAAGAAAPRARAFAPEYWMLDDNVEFKGVVDDDLTFEKVHMLSAKLWVKEGGATHCDTFAALATAEAAAPAASGFAVVGFEKTSGMGAHARGGARVVESAPASEVFVYKALLIRNAFPPPEPGRAAFVSAAEVDFVPGLFCAEDIYFLFRVQLAGGRVAKVAFPCRLHHGRVERKPRPPSPAGPLDWLLPWRHAPGADHVTDAELETLLELHAWFLKMRSLSCKARDADGTAELLAELQLHCDLERELLGFEEQFGKAGDAAAARTATAVEALRGSTREAVELLARKLGRAAKREWPAEGGSVTDFLADALRGAVEKSIVAGQRFRETVLCQKSAVVAIVNVLVSSKQKRTKAVESLRDVLMEATTP